MLVCICRIRHCSRMCKYIVPAYAQMACYELSAMCTPRETGKFRIPVSMTMYVILTVNMQTKGIKNPKYARKPDSHVPGGPWQ